MNDIINILVLEDDSVQITNIAICDMIKTITVIIIEKYDMKYHRLSSGVIESFNRKPKDIRRSALGCRNFDHMRNRLLFATRDAPAILGIPKTNEEAHHYTGLHRGPYKKK